MMNVTARYGGMVEIGRDCPVLPDGKGKATPVPAALVYDETVFPLEGSFGSASIAPVGSERSAAALLTGIAIV